MIRISIRDITSKGLIIDQIIPKEGIGLTDEEIDLRSPISVKAQLDRAGNMVNAQAHIEADFGYLCARCLEEMHSVNEFDYEFHFELNPSDEYVDLGEEIRQELILANPAKILCSVDCKGICAGCGVNLNLEQCKCPTSLKNLHV